MKRVYFSDLSLSDDPETRKWPDMKKQVAEKAPSTPRNAKVRIPGFADYRSALARAIDEKTQELGSIEAFHSSFVHPTMENFSLEEGLDKAQTQLRDSVGTDTPLISPIGSLRSRIALIFDKPAYPVLDHQKSNSSPDTYEYCPYGLQALPR